ncbi:hypothetical protein [Desulfoplanes formicivorans]|nr:hypothetical protein [Desulfoplanes formicivorans]
MSPYSPCLGVLWSEQLSVPPFLPYTVGKEYGSPMREFREVVREIWKGR